MIVLWISLGILLAALIAGVVSLVLTYNKIVSLSARVDNSWAQVDVQLKKRFDLLPNLVETVKGFAKQEEALLKEIVERGRHTKTEKPDRDSAYLNPLFYF